MIIQRKKIAIAVAAAAMSTLFVGTAAAHSNSKNSYFERIATFPVYTNLAADDDVADATAAEITTVSRDGNTLIYSDSPRGRIGFVDIRNPAQPKPAGFVQLEGEPTSVAMHGDYLLVGINTSASFVDPDGVLAVYDFKKPTQPKRVATLPMGGQPDSVAVSPDGRYAAVVIENERDEETNDALIPQLPAGYLNVVTLSGKPAQWSVRKVELNGLSEYAPDDAEPEYVAINELNIAAVTLQENNHIALVDLRRARVIHDFSAGTVDLVDIDTDENDVIEPVGTIENRRREPDAVNWVGPFIATANEGDYEDENGEAGGSRGFTLFGPLGAVWYESNSSLEHAIIRAGHYPESRSENKGAEPEGITSAHYGRNHFMFVGSERANTVAVYDVKKPWAPALHQLLPAGIGPEGLLTIPQRDLLVVSSEEDSADDGFRSMISIYKLSADRATYPEIKSSDKQLLPWGALSGLAADKQQPNRLYAVPDSYYKTSRIFSIDSARTPALIDGETVLHKNGATVNYDLEGIAQTSDGSFWLASEGNGSSTPNLLIKALPNGDVVGEYPLPAVVAAKQKSNGYEGVAVMGSGANERVYVAFQREWTGDPARHVRIGVFNPNDQSWGFFYYPIDSAQAGAWIGLSELTAINDHQFLVVERDNQQGPKAQVKKIYRIDIRGITPVAEGAGSFPVVAKKLHHDLLPDLKATGGWVLDKVEGAAVTTDGKLFVVTDNDGIEDAVGETRFIRLGKVKR